ncbi:MAG: hypothetical protein ABR535_02650 [Pyrinomonadaceae bacterium]
MPRDNPLAAEQMLIETRQSWPARAAVSGIASFIRGYILKAGFLDGFPGFAIAYFAAHNTVLKHLLVIEPQKQAAQRKSN